MEQNINETVIVDDVEQDYILDDAEPLVLNNCNC